MKLLLLCAAALAALFIVKRMVAGEIISPEEAARRVAEGALLIDVRESSEWRAGTVAGAQLLSLSDLQGERTAWAPVLAANRDRELVLYCRSGNRSGIAARLLASEGFRTANAGGFSAWQDAGQPVAKPAP